MPSSIDELLALLDLEPIEECLFRGRQPETSLQRVFGGQVASQALVAAARTTDADRVVHSLHAYFLRPGDTKVPILYDVERTRDGRSFSTRRVVARQHGRPIFYMSASFQVPEEGLDHQDPMPDGRRRRRTAPSSATCWPGSPAAARRLGPRVGVARRPVRRRLPHRAAPCRTTGTRRWPGSGSRPPGRSATTRCCTRPCWPTPSTSPCCRPAVVPHGTYIGDPRLQPASLDHAMWFHRPLRADEWLLYDQVSP